uniref:Uncharacterized protein n=1 Tax=Arundo donax TaxID=35708 RepID=A0A0A9B1Q2_ARUDO
MWNRDTTTQHIVITRFSKQMLLGSTIAHWYIFLHFF